MSALGAKGFEADTSTGLTKVRDEGIGVTAMAGEDCPKGGGHFDSFVDGNFNATSRGNPGAQDFSFNNSGMSEWSATDVLALD